MNSNVQAAMPKFAGLSHVCIFVDDMMEAVDYYQKLLGVVPDHYLSHWRNEGFFKAGGFVKEAADGDVSIAFVNVPDPYHFLGLSCCPCGRFVPAHRQLYSSVEPLQALQNQLRS